MAKGSLPATGPFFALLWEVSPRNGPLVHHKMKGVSHKTLLQAVVQRKAFERDMGP